MNARRTRNLLNACTVAALLNLALAARAVYREVHAADGLEPSGGAGCPAAIVDYTFLGYEGPAGIVGACLARYEYTNGRMTVVAYDATADGLFRNGFEELAP